MNKTLKFLLFEAYRRNAMLLESDKKHRYIIERWLGLGSAAAYKSALIGGYMDWHDGIAPPKRCAGWLVLTEKGVAAMNSLESEFIAQLEKMNAQGYQNTIHARFQLAGRIVCK